MKSNISSLSDGYLAALRTHLKQGSNTDLRVALRLGRRAVALGIQTLELARIHERSLVTLELSNKFIGPVKRAELFFAEAIIPIIETFRAAQQSKTDLKQINATLARRTLELASANRQLRRGVLRRKNVEAALKKSGEQYARLIKDSLKLEDRLRQIAHQVLVAQEDARKKLSHKLQDEVAQTLLGINVRMHTIKQEARSNAKGLKNEIASAQRLVLKSAKSVGRATPE